MRRSLFFLSGLVFTSLLSGCSDEEPSQFCTFVLSPQPEMIQHRVIAHEISLSGPIRRIRFDTLSDQPLKVTMPIAKPFTLAHIPMPVYTRVLFGMSNDDQTYSSRGNGFVGCTPGMILDCPISIVADNSGTNEYIEMRCSPRS